MAIMEGLFHRATPLLTWTSRCPRCWKRQFHKQSQISQTGQVAVRLWDHLALLLTLGDRALTILTRNRVGQDSLSKQAVTQRCTQQETIDCTTLITQRACKLCIKISLIRNLTKAHPSRFLLLTKTSSNLLKRIDACLYHTVSTNAKLICLLFIN